MGARRHLIGGGWRSADVFTGFLRDAGTHARIGCVVLDEGDGEVDKEFARYARRLTEAAPCVPVALPVPIGSRFDPSVLDAVDAVLVCGGLTPAYQQALAPRADELVDLIGRRDLPYAGFSAGAALAARTALVGGWLDGGVPVCPPDSAEDLEDVTVAPGLGLVPFTVDVHAAQWGTLPRLIAAVARGDVREGVALDEDTLITYEPGAAPWSAALDVRTSCAAGTMVWSCAPVPRARTSSSAPKGQHG
ncbi:hypothetical protein V2W30_01890 [Streptomyces sp. Q6]|uniref:Uncharacterized protein n=1 Tax=Streptomyces citrinus TaxID=3118173 RepID=A0ACD5A4V9_9ACTN